MKIIKWLKESKIVDSFDVIEYKTFYGGFYIKINAELSDKSQLFIKEYSGIEERNYSYHWQSANHELLCRWDNAPHYQTLFNFPHHKHLSNNTLPSEEMNLLDVLNFITNSLK